MKHLASSRHHASGHVAHSFRPEVPNLFWQQGLASWETFFRRRWGADRRRSSDSHASGASLAHLQLTSCCAAQSLTGQGPVPVHSLGSGDSCFRQSTQQFIEVDAIITPIFQTRH